MRRDHDPADREPDLGDRTSSIRQELTFLLPYARRHAGLLLATLAISVSLAVVDVPVPLILKKLIDAALSRHGSAHLFGAEMAPRPFLTRVLIVLIALAVVKGALVFLQRAVAEQVGQRMVFELRLDLYRHLHSLSLRFFRRSRTGKLMLRLMGDVKAVLDMITGGFLRALMDGITVVAVAAVILALNVRLALVVLAILPPYALALWRLSPAMRESGRRARRERSRLSGNLQEKIAGASIVKAFHRQDAEARLLATQTGRLRDRLVEKARMGGLLSGIAQSSVAVGGALVLGVGGVAVLDGRLTKGGLMAFYALATMLFPPLRRLARTNETWQSARVSLERIVRFLETTETLREPAGGAEPPSGPGAVRFEAVRFTYDGRREALRGIDLEIRGGEVVAIVGENGAGKSTLASLVPRFNDPDEGRVLLDGADVRDLSLASLRRSVAYVEQEPVLFSGTIAENLRYARPEATEQQIVEAARLAGALGFVSGLPDGFDTDVGERGRRLSGGQVQRIALARAALCDPRVLILDEATSAVDPESEERIRDAIARLMPGRTVLIIAHRASTVRRADRIVVMQDGRIVEQGTHEDLLLAGGPYARSFAAPGTGRRVAS